VDQLKDDIADSSLGEYTLANALNQDEGIHQLLSSVTAHEMLAHLSGLSLITVAPVTRQKLLSAVIPAPTTPMASLFNYPNGVADDDEWAYQLRIPLKDGRAVSGLGAYSFKRRAALPAMSRRGEGVKEDSGIMIRNFETFAADPAHGGRGRLGKLKIYGGESKENDDPESENHDINSNTSFGFLAKKSDTFEAKNGNNGNNENKIMIKESRDINYNWVECIWFVEPDPSRKIARCYDLVQIREMSEAQIHENDIHAKNKATNKADNETDNDDNGNDDESDDKGDDKSDEEGDDKSDDKSDDNSNTDVVAAFHPRSVLTIRTDTYELLSEDEKKDPEIFNSLSLRSSRSSVRLIRLDNGDHYFGQCKRGKDRGKNRGKTRGKDGGDSENSDKDDSNDDVNSHNSEENDSNQSDEGNTSEENDISEEEATSNNDERGPKIMDRHSKWFADGFGILTHPDGGKYTGGFKNGHQHDDRGTLLFEAGHE
jgi:hypothetical protein